MLRTIATAAARAVAVTASTAAVLLALAGPAAATDVTAGRTSPAVTAPAMRLDIFDIRAVGFRVCAIGSTTTPGTWQLAIDGARSDGSVITLSRSHYGTSWTTANCLDVLEYGTLSGEFQVRYTFSRPGERPYVQLGGGTWDLLTGEHSWDTAN